MDRANKERETAETCLAELQSLMARDPHDPAAKNLLGRIRNAAARRCHDVEPRPYTAHCAEWSDRYLANGYTLLGMNEAAAVVNARFASV